jgi:tight adherence protein B
VIARAVRLRRRLPRSGRRLADRLASGRAASALRSRLRAADLEPDPAAWVRRAGARLGAFVALGTVWLGIPGAALGFAAGAAWPLVGLRLRRQRRGERMDAALPDALESVAAAMRAGLGLARAFRAADVTPPADAAVRALVARLDVGAPVEEALEAFAEATGVPAGALVATALRIGYRAGGDLPRVLEALAASLRERDEVAREMRAATAQARLSAWVVAGMPVAFLFLMGATSREQTRLLLRTPIGWGLLGVGLSLEAAGLLWMRRVVSPR